MVASCSAHPTRCSRCGSPAGDPNTGGDRDRFSVVSVTLDWVAQQLPAPDLIKVDVEGAELGVLEHAGPQVIHSSRPRWIIEVAAENAGPIAEILRAARYRLFDANAPNAEVEWPAWNTLAVPEEKL